MSHPADFARWGADLDFHRTSRGPEILSIGRGPRIECLAMTISARAFPHAAPTAGRN